MHLVEQLDLALELGRVAVELRADVGVVLRREPRGVDCGADRGELGQPPRRRLLALQEVVVHRLARKPSADVARKLGLVGVADDVVFEPR